MKAQVENRLIAKSVVKVELFNKIIDIITTSSNEDELREKMALFGGLQYFEFGFGGHHMWVHEKVSGETLRDRLIFVEF